MVTQSLDCQSMQDIAELKAVHRYLRRDGCHAWLVKVKVTREIRSLNVPWQPG